MSDTRQNNRVERCEQAAQDRSESAAAQFNLGLAYMQKGRIERAEQAYRSGIVMPEAEWVDLNPAILP